jgi:uncharacterized protein (TIGR02171 family)
MIKLVGMLALALCLGFIGCSNSEFNYESEDNPDNLDSLSLDGFVRVRSMGKTVTLGTDDEFASVKDRPSMEASFDYDFLIGKQEVTCGDMGLACAGKLPATNVTYFDAILYANKMSKSNGFDTVYSYTGLSFDGDGACVGMDGLVFNPQVQGFRLPTEAEWIYAAGLDWQPEKGWHNGNSDFELHPVCTSYIDKNGICDMAGNALEWVNDLWVPFHSKGVGDFVGGKPLDGIEERVLKGGSVHNASSSIHLYNRGDVYMVTSSTKASYVGFRLAFGAIPSPSYLDEMGNEIQINYSLLVKSSAVKKFVDKPLSKLVFREDVHGNLAYVDFNDAYVSVVEMNTGVSAYHPDISPDGRYVAFCTGLEGVSGPSKVYVRRLSENDTPVELPAESAAIPRFRVLENGDTVIVYVSDAGNNKDDAAFKSRQTWQVRFSNGKFGKPKKLFDGAYHGGVSKDGKLAVTGSQLLRASVDGSERVWYGKNQACNVSLSQGGADKTLFLDFGAKMGRDFVGATYRTHERALIANRTGKLIQSVSAPKGFTFDHVEWVNGSDSLFVATLVDANGAHRKIMLVNANTSKMLSLVEGTEVWHPAFWAHERNANVRWDYDSLGFYYSENGQATQFLAQRIPLLWMYRDSAEVVCLGNSHMQMGVAANQMSLFAINLAAVPCDLHCVEELYEKYVSPQVTNLKYLVIGLDFDLWGEYEPGESMAWNKGEAPGFVYDANHEFWREGVDSLFVARVSEIAESHRGFASVRSNRGWTNGFCVLDWSSNGKEFAEVLVDSAWSDDSRRYESNFAELDRILKIAEQHNVVVVGLIFPLSPYYQNTGSYGRHGMRRSTAKMLQERLEKLSLENENFVLMDENKMGKHDYLGDVAYDYDHLCWRGAGVLTMRLDSLLKTLEKSPR